ncbi:MAG TPA: tetrathionate reductase family octaheme c-type cytochrome [Candidatus Sumerlaeota bacterium]|nr:tetrathionate reductase family octaheme c-type cytochrome [Candidatus Sumerlaeota bacterium]
MIRTTLSPLFLSASLLLSIWVGFPSLSYGQAQTVPPSSTETGVPAPAPWKAPDLEKAKAYSQKPIPPLVVEVVEKDPSLERKAGSTRPFLLSNSLYEFLVLKLEYDFFLLNSPIIKKEDDFYQPVRFTHAKHAAVTQNCTVCHHAAPKDSREQYDTTPCNACHQESFNKTVFGRLGLKAAYHRQCVTCHAESQNPRAPTDCIGCHGENVKDHSQLIELTGTPTPSEVTRECVRCHEGQAEDFMKSSHWLWKTAASRAEALAGKSASGKAATALNNSCIALPGNWADCTSCHCGYGWEDKNFDFTDKSRIDCLVCHDTTGLYKKDPNKPGLPADGVDLLAVAKKVGRTSRQTCGACHFQNDKNDPTQHAYMNGQLMAPSRDFDIHMGGYDMRCEDCHKTRKHKIPGKSSSLATTEGTVSCEACHTETPHSQGPLIYHLNRHGKNVACTTCHSPLYARSNPTRTRWDWSRAGDKARSPQLDSTGSPDYNWKFGEFTWQKNIKPQFAWYSGKMKQYQQGDPFAPTDLLNITFPLGNIADPESKIYPFMVLRGKQPADAQNNTLAVPRFSGPDGYWETLDWNRSIQNGMQDAGLPYSGEFKWQETAMYWRAEHEVMPKEYALPCAQCHTALKSERTCDRCHQESKSLDYKALANKGFDLKKNLGLEGGNAADYNSGENYINFQKLGYEGDPIEVGGRFKILPLGYSQTPR